MKVIIRKPWSGFNDLTSNWLISMPTISGMLFILVTVLQSFQESVGIPTGSITLPDPYGGLLSLAYSPIVEEIGFRFTPIGTIVAISLSRYLKFKFLPLAIIWPDKGKSWARLPTIHDHGLKGITVPEWTAIFGTSTIFGLIHYTAGGGWNVGKISSAAVAGIALAMIYLWKGIHASILLHWFFNYYGYIWDVAETVHQSLFINLSFVIYGFTLFLGILGWIILTWKIGVNIKKKMVAHNDDHIFKPPKMVSESNT